MADAFVSFSVQKLCDFLIQQVSLHTNLRKEIEWLRNELLFIQSFLRDVEQKQSRDQRADKGDDDEFASRLKACACIFRKEKKLYNVAEEIQSLKQRISIVLIQEKGQDNIFVGLHDVVQKLLVELLKAEPRRSVFSIYGMGRLGKTTLARKLYTSPDILNNFPTRAWICVSQEYNTMDLLRNIIKSIQGCTKETLDLLERMTERDLEIYLRDLLKDRKFLVVVDDVWQREA
ncbi:hypothetical protein KY285_019561 [Solanum tuberosum]|nr:hypothetical protein KY285_019561 [Solanum tuberosum]